ncbi:tctex1 domain-containing protein 2-like [Ceratina calcarata]|uniref:Tctex1 domain-containing protein 2-like n=1 Tax=Ceratina calcarata TaxID=156304 RepID=A0AAJ7N455_9HYME|nr:tctex1 domain-containing protein 2-like [Ceratina calcarata]
MNQQSSKPPNELRASRYKSAANIRKLSATTRQVQFNGRSTNFSLLQSRRRLPSSRISGLSSGSRMFFYRRADRLKIPKYQNTYRLESFRKFDVEVIDMMVENVMVRKLSPVTAYHPNQMSRLCSDIGSDLQTALCRKDYDRYKLVVQVTIVQRFDQGIHSGAQCLWDVERDNYSYYLFENNHIYAWCCVFGMYYE